MYTVYEVYREGIEMPESWWRPRRVVGNLVFGEGSLSRYRFPVANVLGADAMPLLGELQYARQEAYKGMLAVRGLQKPAHVKDLEWRKRSYPQLWLCVPLSKE